jgi:hypothetical protein
MEAANSMLYRPAFASYSGYELCSTLAVRIWHPVCTIMNKSIHHYSNNEPGHLSSLDSLLSCCHSCREWDREPPTPTPPPLTINIFRLYKEFIRERNIMKPTLRLKGTILRIYWLLILFQWTARYYYSSSFFDSENKTLRWPITLV